MASWLQDFRYAFRLLARRPLFAALVIVTLALGVGADTAIFAVARGVLAPFPYRDADRVVTIWSRWDLFPKTWVSQDEARAYKQGAPSLSTLALYSWGGVNLGGDEPARIQVGTVSAEIFAALGVDTRLGRPFTVEEDREQARVVVLTEELWRRLGASPTLVGQSVQLDGNNYQVVGVLPPGIRLPEDYRQGETSVAWVPLGIDLDAAPGTEGGGGSHNYFAVGRLAAGATPRGLQAELDAVTEARKVAGIYAPTKGFATLSFPLQDDVLGAVTPILRVLAVAVALVLLLAAANVVHLLVVRQHERGAELAVRVALGSSRGGLVRLLAAETLLLSLAGSAVGLVLAQGALFVLHRVAPPGLPRLEAVAIDGVGALFALGLGLTLGLAIGVIAARRALTDAGLATLQSGRGTVGRIPRGRRLALVAVEMGMAVILLIGAALLVRTVQGLLAIDPGFEPRGAMTFRVNLPSSTYPTPADVAAFVQRADARFAALPGVKAAGAIRNLPLATQMGDRGVDVEGYTRRPDESTPSDWQVVSPGAVPALGLRVVAGRSLGAAEAAAGEPSVLVNEAFVRRYWPGATSAEAVGRRIKLRNQGAPWATIAGVVADLRHNDLLQTVKPGFFWPHAQFASSVGSTPRGMTFVVRTEGPPAAIWPALRAVLAELDPKLPPAEVYTLEEATSVATAPSRFAAGVLLALAGLALLLAAVGVYGVLAWSVALRQREIGVRLALGAQRSDVLKDVLREGLGAAGLGLGAGLLVAFWLVSFLGTLVHGIGLRDPGVFLFAPLLLVAVAFLASLLPAWRASRVDPVVVLRAE